MLDAQISRPIEIAAFLSQHHWESASAQGLDSDFSPRRYARLTKADGKTAILMDADESQKTPTFVALAKLLRSLQLNAPLIYAADPSRGLALLEDFGSQNIGALLDKGSNPDAFFMAAAEILAKLHAAFNPTMVSEIDLPLYNTNLFVRQVELFLDTYFPFVMGRDASPEERQDFCAAWQAVLQPINAMPKSLLLRDFMPDNLMDLPDHSLGLLDFQDAGIGPIAYDLASMCEVVRREGAFSLLPKIISHYVKCANSSLSENDLKCACTLLSAQRHTRILGIISQLALKSGRREKLDFMPRIHTHLKTILKEPYLIPVREWMGRFESLLP